MAYLRCVQSTDVSGRITSRSEFVALRAWKTEVLRKGVDLSGWWILQVGEIRTHLSVGRGRWWGAVSGVRVVFVFRVCVAC